MGYGIEDGIVVIKAHEELTYALHCKKVGTPTGLITNPSMTVTRLPDGLDVTGSVTSGSPCPTVSGQYIPLCTIKSLVEGTSYRVDILYNKDGQVVETEFPVYCPSRVGAG